MARKQAETLSEKHWQALKLIEEGLARKAVAGKMGWSPDYFKKLCAGDIENCGYTADLFKKELNKVEEKRDEATKVLIKENVSTAQGLIQSVLAEFKSKKKLKEEEKKLLATLTNALNKSTPSVNIKNLSYSYTQGLTPEELIYEYERLRSITESSFNSRRVQSSGSSGSGTVPEADEPGIGLAEDS